MTKGALTRHSPSAGAGEPSGGASGQPPAQGLSTMRGHQSSFGGSTAERSSCTDEALEASPT
eukprot:1863450-Alexandrium_andersonii.AAC.1